MKVKFVDYSIEHKGYWDYGYKYWLTEQKTSEKGKPESIIIIKSNDLKEVANKLQELSSTNLDLEFEVNESLEKHKNELKI